MIFKIAKVAFSDKKNNNYYFFVVLPLPRELKV
jgi:hypothetical protein